MEFDYKDPDDCVSVNFNYWFFRSTLVPRKDKSEMTGESYETLTWVDILSFWKERKTPLKWKQEDFRYTVRSL